MYLSLFLAFLCGILFKTFWNYLVGLGYGLEAFKKTTEDCLLMMAKNMQSVIEIQQLKEMYLGMIDRDEKYISFQRQLDKREILSMKNTIIRNFMNSVPPRYNRIIKFHNWDSAMDYLNLLTKGEQK
jgi:hypothetical protein